MKSALRAHPFLPAILLVLASCGGDRAAAPQPSAEAPPAASSAPAAAPDVSSTAAASASAAGSERSPCGDTSAWKPFVQYPSGCGYVYSTDEATLPAPVRWKPCTFAGLPDAATRCLDRATDASVAGLGPDGVVHVGFKHTCGAKQIVVAEADGRTRFALAATKGGGGTWTCDLGIRAVDHGKWLAALGGDKDMAEGDGLGGTKGGAFIGGDVGGMPRLLTTVGFTFDAAGGGGAVSDLGWFAAMESGRWSGKDFEQLPEGRDWIASNLVASMSGVYLKARGDDELVARPAEGRQFVSFRGRGKQLVWTERTTPVAGKETECWLIHGETRKDLKLVARRVGSISCKAAVTAGCGYAVARVENKSLTVIKLADGSTLELPVRAKHVEAVCKDLFLLDGRRLVRAPVDSLGSFSPPKEPPAELRDPAAATALDAGAPAASASASASGGPAAGSAAPPP